MDTFSQDLEKAQRIENAKVQVKAFQDRKRRQLKTSNFTAGQSLESELSNKMGREDSGLQLVGTWN